MSLTFMQWEAVLTNKEMFFLFQNSSPGKDGLWICCNFCSIWHLCVLYEQPMDSKAIQAEPPSDQSDHHRGSRLPAGVHVWGSHCVYVWHSFPIAA